MKTPPESTLPRIVGHVRIIASIITLLSVAVCVPAIDAATLLVTNTSDTGPDAPAPGSLRAALVTASDGDTIDATGLTGTITLVAGTGQPVFPSDLVIDKAVTILGPGAAKLTIDANQVGRAFDIADHTVTISDMTITHGIGLGGGGLNGRGGAIRSTQSQLTLNRCVISNNSADHGAGIYNDGYDAGVSNVTINDCIFSDNTAGISGGAIHSSASIGSAVVVIANSTFSNNVSTRGGAILNNGGELNVKNSTFSGNSAGDGYGGAIVSQDGPSSIVNSTISGNSAKIGGGIYNRDGTAVLANCTLSGNTAPQGGAVFNKQFKTATSLSIGDSILRAGAGGVNIYNEYGTIISYGYNLSSDNGVESSGGTGGLNAATDRLNIDPLLGPLAANGGPTLTHLPLPGSPARDGGTSDLLAKFDISTDQRGFTRTVDDPAITNAFLSDGTDIGAVEVEIPAPPPAADVLVSLGVDKSSVKQGDQLTYTITVKNFGPGAATNVIINDTLSSGTTFVSAKANKGSFTAPSLNQTGVVTWNLGDLSNGSAEDAQLVVKVIIKGKTTITNTASASTASSDPNLTNNSAAITTTVASGGSTGGRK